MSNDEVTYFEGEDVRITNARAVIGQKTYVMANITTVMMREKPANRNQGIFVALFGVLIGGCIGSMIDNFGIGAILGFVIIIVGAFIAFNSKASYFVRIESASGEADALQSDNKAYIQEIVNAMNEAIIKQVKG